MLKKLDIGLLGLAILMVAGGGIIALTVAPAEQSQGEVYRIIFVHVPCAWVSMIAYTVSFVASVVYLFKSGPRADAIAEASAEVGLVFNALLLITGAIWGKPTWGVWWTWDPRLTAAAIMFFAYAGYLALRHFVDMPDKRSMWAAVIGILIFVNIPIVWFSVKWWNTLHQVQSVGDAGSTDPAIARIWAFNALAFLVTYLFLVRQRYFLARTRQAFEAAEPPPLTEPPEDAA